jgi:hypothetical protein
MVYSQEFLTFWAAYPNKVKKPIAASSWESEQPDLQAVLVALEWQKRTPEWLKDKGAFIPHASTYINQRRWEDEPKTVTVPPRKGEVF